LPSRTRCTRPVGRGVGRHRCWWRKIAGAPRGKAGGLARRGLPPTATQGWKTRRAGPMGPSLLTSLALVPAAGTPDLRPPRTTRWRSAIGIHGEPGRRREKLAPRVDDMAEVARRPDRRGSRGWTRGDKRPRVRQMAMGGSPVDRALCRLQTAWPRSSVARGISIGRSPGRQLHHEPRRWPASRSPCSGSTMS